MIEIEEGFLTSQTSLGITVFVVEEPKKRHGTKVPPLCWSRGAARQTPSKSARHEASATHPKSGWHEANATHPKSAGMKPALHTPRALA